MQTFSRSDKYYIYIYIIYSLPLRKAVIPIKTLDYISDYYETSEQESIVLVFYKY